MEIGVFRDWQGGKQRIATLSRESGVGSERFQYCEAFVEHGGLGVSEMLPLSSEPYDSRAVAPFFQGLLPEGEVVARIAQTGQIPRNDWFALIGMLGCESIGALTFATGQLSNEYAVGYYEPVTYGETRALRERPSAAAAYIASSTRLSLSGAQSKVAWTLPEGLLPEQASFDDWLVPHDGAASTHIIKISRNGEEELAANELACSLLAGSCGIDTVSIFEIPQIPGAIAVERYDRVWADSKDGRVVLRAHQEDFCQALGLAPFYKYQPEGVEADYIEMAGDLLNEAAVFPARDRVEFAKRLVFNYTIGNSDAHLKNSSLLYSEDWTSRSLAPLYDVTCIPLSTYSTRMPFDIGSHRELNEIDEHDIFKICLSADAPMDAFDVAVAEVVKGFESPRLPSCGEAAETMVSRILENSKPRLMVLKRYLESVE